MFSGGIKNKWHEIGFVDEAEHEYWKFCERLLSYVKRDFPSRSGKG